MYPKVEYEMTEEDLKDLLAACKPVPCMMIGGITPASPQENANRAWRELGAKMGFDWQTVQPIPGKGTRFFTAVPLETIESRKERLEREAEEKRLARIADLSIEIGKLQAELDNLKGLSKCET